MRLFRDLMIEHDPAESIVRDFLTHLIPRGVVDTLHRSQRYPRKAAKRAVKSVILSKKGLISAMSHLLYNDNQLINNQ
jgi:hypothetical protein